MAECPPTGLSRIVQGPHGLARKDCGNLWLCTRLCIRLHIRLRISLAQIGEGKHKQLFLFGAVPGNHVFLTTRVPMRDRPIYTAKIAQNCEADLMELFWDLKTAPKRKTNTRISAICN